MSMFNICIGFFNLIMCMVSYVFAEKGHNKYSFVILIVGYLGSVFCMLDLPEVYIPLFSIGLFFAVVG